MLQWMMLALVVPLYTRNVTEKMIGGTAILNILDEDDGLSREEIDENNGIARHVE